MLRSGRAAARSIISLTRPRSRQAYTWNQRRPSLTDRTSSIERVLSVDSVYGRPARVGGACDGELALGVGDAGEAGRGEHQRVGERASEEGGVDVDVD